MNRSSAIASIQRSDHRRRRAMSLTSRVMDIVRDHVDHADWRKIYDEIFDVFSLEGVEILTDLDRQLYGLSPRGPDGWTVEEIVALERLKLEAMLKPLSIIIPMPKDSP